ncbi:MAG: type VII toxin-antitoxin system MntA family adenylyltransferase antitoxin [Bacillota bacterium]
MVFDKKAVNFLAEKHHIRLILLFGSRSKNDYRLESDIDLGVLFESKPGDLTLVIADFRKTFPDYPIDLVVLNHSDPVLKFEIISNYQILYCKDQEVFINFYLNTIKQHNDIKKFLALEQIYLNKFIGGARSGIHQCHPPEIN